MKKRFSFFVLFIVALSACVQDIDLNFQSNENKIAITCFFNPDSIWKVNVYSTFSINETDSQTGIDDAQVQIRGEDGTKILLINMGNGMYLAHEKPKPEVVYNLTVYLAGHDTITATSSIPSKSQLNGIESGKLPEDVVLQNNIWTEMYPTSFTVVPPSQQEQCFRIRAMVFDTVKGYNTYHFDENSFLRMRQLGVDQTAIDKLAPLSGQTFYGDICSKLGNYLTKGEQSTNCDKIGQAAFLGKTTQRQAGGYSLIDCISNIGLFYQTTYETYTLLGKFSKEVPVKIYTNNFYKGEYWLECLDLSKEYYQFQKDYLLQLSNRGNLNAAPVIVYSNIQNGTGIFAGYQKQMIHLITYQMILKDNFSSLHSF
ncbi:DUF4249 family protein [uncultured Sunxiuqinia sp.]|uniref:DUF4249 family protein n=1 Tax=uncultured Sunxiuqinia sp. TaxID=1573825 RepID=UPI002AA63F00|nr:DUF4249 family protein [uncultured Sunxiuqinia sp.]